MRRLYAVLLMLFLPLIGMAEESLFTIGEPHVSQLDYRQYFETMSAQAGQCTIAIAKDAYGKEAAEQLHAQVIADEAVLAAFGDMRPHTVYVVKKPMAGMQQMDAAIYCTAAQVLDGSYRSWLAAAAFGLERWQGVGLAGCAFDVTLDTQGLTDWYAEDAHDDMLSLFSAYFVSDFATAEELHMAEQTATALTAYIMEQHGKSAVMSANAEDYVPEWLASLGIDRPYDDPYAGVLEGYAYTHNQFYPLIATSPKGDVFKLKPLFDMHTPSQVRLALSDLELAVDAILAGVQQDAPAWYPVLRKNYEGPITYEFGENDGISITYFDNRRVTVGSAETLIHETTHMMAPCKFGRISRYMDQWKTEGIAEYLTHAYYQGRLTQEAALAQMQPDFISQAEEKAEARAFYERLRRIYQRCAPQPETAACVDLTLFWRAAVLAKEELGMQRQSVVNVHSGAGAPSLDAVNGNELSYAEAEWLASYLINRSSLSTFLHYCMDEGISFEDAFSMSYEDAKADWLANRTLLD